MTDDDLSPMRGCLLAVVLGCAMWAFILSILILAGVL